MALHLLSWSPLRTFGSPTIMGSLAACRWNSTSAPAPAPKPFVVPRNAAHSRVPKTFGRRRIQNRQKFLQDQKAQGESRVLEKFQTRDWKAGDIYAPHDLSPAEMKKWRKRYSPSTDAFDSLNMNPLDLYKRVQNFSIMSEYITPMGRIKHRSATGLRPVNQRKIAKAIRRAIGLGLMPSVHKHPEILAAEMKARADGGSHFF
ncbi:37S ribosomal protein S18 [Aspergillus terreus]|uniref:Small ribosomal subunit protein bS18m n=1 Tax=Aspergillus terreus TaxID=33178 RepID=A0A5M3ZAJ3_ASPTE|nr:hypothetical protein ATETN484_0010054300 [Aspergillus terreus]GFF18590.1 37S ribosomal protein S18 [Aspergillus terreus]